MIGSRCDVGAARQAQLAASVVALDHEPLGSLEQHPEAARFAAHAVMVARTRACVSDAVRRVLAAMTTLPQA